MGQVTGMPLLSHADRRAADRGRDLPVCQRNGARWVALIATLIDFALSIYLWVAIRSQRPAMAVRRKVPLGGGDQLGARDRRHRAAPDRAHDIPDADLYRRELALDREARAGIYGLFPADGGADIGSFAAQDLFLFYVFFEGGLIPMYLIIGVWGGAERIKASYKFFLYTLLGSVLMLIAMLYMATPRTRPRSRC